MAVSIEVSEEAGVRYLHFGSRWIQGAMRVARPYSLELEYTRLMMLPLLLRSGARWPRQTLLIGLGAASLAKFLYRHRPDAGLTVVEIEPGVVSAARQFFKLPVDPKRLNIVIGEGHDVLAESPATFDLIAVDGYDARGRTGMLDTSPFYWNARAHLGSRGMVVTNLMSRVRGKPPPIDAIRQAFDGRAIALPPCEGGNTIVVAASGDPIDMSFTVLSAAARRLKEDTGLNLLPTVAGMASRSSRNERFVL